jgi:hypothetical protein
MLRLRLWILATILACLSSCDNHQDAQSHDGVSSQLKVVIIRHAEKPDSGDNLSCQGQNRALQLPNVLMQKFKKIKQIYVPALNLGKATTHVRMLQTATPLAIKYNLAINSQYGADDYDKVTSEILKKKGTILMVWEHSAIHSLVKAFGVKHPPEWQDDDFDSIWEITFSEASVSLTIEHEQLTPSKDCSF